MVGSARPSGPSPVNWRLGSTSRMKPGVEKISAGRRSTSVFCITILAKEFCSISVRKFRPERRAR
ncbi:hypothetical protein D9M68_883700 [compost metagenome]